MPSTQSSTVARLADVAKSYSGRPVLQDFNLTLEAGSVVALLSPNGAGKSTLINILAGLTRFSTGRVSVLGHDVVTDYRQTRRK